MKRVVFLIVSALAVAGVQAQVTIDLSAIGPLSTGQTYNDPVCLSAIQATSTQVLVSSSNSQRISVPPSVTIAAGSLCTQVPVTAGAFGQATVTVTVPSLGGITDSESATSLLILTVSGPQHLAPGATGQGQACINAIQNTPTIVELASDNSAVGTVPANVTIPAGGTCVPFSISALTEGFLVVTGTLPAATGGHTSSVGTQISTPVDLSVTGSDSADPVFAGAPLTYTLVARNNGPNATNVTVRHALEAEYVSATSTQGSCEYSMLDNSAYCYLGALASGATATVTVQVTAPTTPGTITGTGSVSPPNSIPDPDLSNNSVAITTLVQATGTAFNSTRYVVNEASGPATITILRSNSSSAATVTFHASAYLGPSAASGSDFTAVSQLVSFNAGEASKVVNVPITNDSEVEFSEWVQLSLSGASDGSPDRSATLLIEDDDDTKPADLAVTVSGPAAVPGGQNVTYTVVATNNGPNPTLVEVNDDANAGFVSGTSSQGTCELATIGGYICQLGTLAPGASATVTVTFVAPAGGETITNTATVRSPVGAPDPVPANNTATTQTVTQRNFAFSHPEYVVYEGIPNAVITVLRFDTSGTGNVTFSMTSGGNATPNSDYTPVTQILNFADGVSSRTVNVPIVADVVAEEEEAVVLQLSGASDGSRSQTALLRIKDRVFDPNGDQMISVADAFYIVNHLFANGPPPTGASGPIISGDANGDNNITVSDVFYLIAYLFAGGPPPAG